MHIDTAISTWMLDLRAENKSRRTIEWYAHKLPFFAEWLTSGGVTSVESLTPEHMKGFLRHLDTLDRSINSGRSFKKGKVSSLTAHGYAQVIGTCVRSLARPAAPPSRRTRQISAWRATAFEATSRKANSFTTRRRRACTSSGRGCRDVYGQAVTSWP